MRVQTSSKVKYWQVYKCHKLGMHHAEVPPQQRKTILVDADLRDVTQSG